MRDTWAIRAGQVFDGHDLHQGLTVLVTDGVVAEVGPAVLGEFPLLDLGDDVTLLPGLVDTHVHLAFDATTDVLAGMDLDDDVLLVRMRAAALATVEAGVTTVRDLGDRSFLAVELGYETATGRSPGPTIVASGPPLTTPRGHCWFLGGEAATLEDLLKGVHHRAERGCGVVKVMVSGGNITPGSSPFASQFGADVLAQVVSEAHQLGLPAAAHVHAPGSVVDALDAGFDTLEHVTFMTEAGVEPPPGVLQRIVDSGVFVSLTAGVLEGAAPPPAIAARLDQVQANHRWLFEQGARIAIGSDAGVAPTKPHGVLPHALRQLDGEVPPLATLRAMTAVAAEAIGLAGRKGCLAPGADADLLAVHGDPTRDPEAIHRVVGVWARGVRVR